MNASLITRTPALQEGRNGAVSAMLLPNGARLAQISAARASGIGTLQAQPFDGAHGSVARQAQAFIHRHFRGPVCMEDLSRATRVGVRTLQRYFKQCFGETVQSYLKSVRLDAAYRDLIAADSSRDTVTAIALRNGCSHLGRFSCDFRERFGQLPSEMLRKRRPITVCDARMIFCRSDATTNGADIE